MRKAIFEYIELTDEEKKALWESATFVFDTNVLLNLYRYTAKTRDRLLQSLEELRDKLWMPHHVAEEFMKDRCKVISYYNSDYSKMQEGKRDFIKKHLIC